ncbi:MAG: hypothetical protein JWM21_1394 [Acidobacteria bacterium]|nr:hypothetical protein [Acidobacteriota bacterium]
MQSIDDLARTIIELAPTDQMELLERVARLNFQKGLEELARKYQSRLTSENCLDTPTEKVWDELRSMREEVVSRDYPN